MSKESEIYQRIKNEENTGYSPENVVKTRSGIEYSIYKQHIDLGDYGETVGYIALLDGEPANHSEGAWIFPTEQLAKETIEKKWR